MDPKFGDKVIIRAKLSRQYDGSDGKYYRKAWVRFKFREPKTGILIGFRTLADGRVESMGDDGVLFHPTQYLRAALVVTGPRSKPVLVRPEDMEASC